MVAGGLNVKAEKEGNPVSKIVHARSRGGGEVPGVL